MTGEAKGGALPTLDVDALNEALTTIHECSSVGDEQSFDLVAAHDVVRQQVDALVKELEETRTERLRFRHGIKRELERIAREFCSACGNNRGLISKLANDVRTTLFVEYDPEFDGPRERVKLLEAELESLKAQKLSLVAQRNEALRTNEALRSDIKQSVDALRTLTEELDRLKEEREKTRQALGLANKPEVGTVEEAWRVVQTCDQFLTDRDFLQSEVIASEEAMRKVTSTLEEMKAGIGELRKGIANLAAERDGLQVLLDRGVGSEILRTALRKLQHDKSFMCCQRAVGGRCYEMRVVDAALAGEAFDE